MCVSSICTLQRLGSKEMTERKRKMKTYNTLEIVKKKMLKIGSMAMKKEPGIDGILVTVGLCIIALLLCVVMKESIGTFINTIVTALTNEAQKILTGVSGMVLP